VPFSHGEGSAALAVLRTSPATRGAVASGHFHVVSVRVLRTHTKTKKEET